jgi:maltose alpha-D-glucosyltransferase/alpha-amylase
MISLRRKHQAFGSGKLVWIDNDDPSIVTWIRAYKMDVMLVVSNTCNTAKATTIKIPSALLIVNPYNEATDILTNNKIPMENDSISVELDPYGFMWIELSRIGPIY